MNLFMRRGRRPWRSGAASCAAAAVVTGSLLVTGVGTANASAGPAIAALQTARATLAQDARAGQTEPGAVPIR
jgi:hypothetical protein